MSEQDHTKEKRPVESSQLQALPRAAKKKEGIYRARKKEQNLGWPWIIVGAPMGFETVLFGKMHSGAHGVHYRMIQNLQTKEKGGNYDQQKKKK